MHIAHKFRFALILAALSFVGCHKNGDTNTSHNDGGSTDSDSGTITNDASTIDANTTDATTLDAQVVDLGAMDSAIEDAGLVDAQTADAAVDAGPPPSGDVCATDAPLLTAGTRDDTLMGYAANYAFATSMDGSCNPTGDGAAGIDRAYRVVVPAGQNLAVTAIPLSATDLILNLVAGSDPTLCGASAVNCAATMNVGAAGDPEMLTFSNASDVEFDGFLVVSGLAGRGAGDFTLTTTLGTSPDGDTCSEAILTLGAGRWDYAGGSPLSGYASDFAPTGEGSNCTFLVGADIVFRVRVPAGDIGYASIKSDTFSDQELSLSVMDAATDCTSAGFACVTSAYVYGGRGEGAVNWRNTTSAAADYFIVVDTTNLAQSFTLAFATSAPATTGNTCATATPLTGPITNEGLLGYTDAYSLSTTNTNCNFSSFVDRVFSISVPAGNRLSLDLPPASDGVSDIPIINLVANPSVNCTSDSVTCTGSAELVLNGVTDTTLGWSNTSDSAVTVDLIVSPPPYVLQLTASFDETFSITPTITPLLDGETCHNATPILSEGPFTTSTLGYGRDYQGGTNCAPMNSIDRVFSVVVPNGDMLVAAASFATVSIVVGTANDCDAPSLTCTAAGDFVNETPAVYTNSSGSDVVAYIILGTPDATASGGDVPMNVRLIPAP